jgi:LmbE family N-acetylglucosaminyl deacetylase
MAETFRLMCVMAHPDDETFGTGGTLAKYGAEGVETYLVTATRGERGWFGDEKDYPGPEALGQIREGELRAAAQVLGLREVSFLDYVDGDLDQADPAEAIARIVGHLRRVRPHVVITFDPLGNYGHPDHIAISQLTAAALVCAADAGYVADGLPPHRASKFYYMVDRKEIVAEYESLVGEIVMAIDGVERRPVPWEDWAITTWLDATAHWRSVWQAAACHRTQLPNFDTLANLPEERHRRLWGTQTYYRAFSLVNGGRQIERDLFAGLR